MKRILFFGLLLLAACSQAPAPTSEANAELVAQRLGTRADDAATSVALDTKLGAVYVMGVTEGSLGGANKGKTDVILQRYNRSGKVVWGRQLGGSSYDRAGGVATDSQGFLYAGYTTGTSGKLEKFRADGTSVWSRTLQIDAAYSEMYVAALSTDANDNIYVAGATGYIGEIMFLRKYSSTGLLLWTQQVEGYGLFFYPTSVGTDRSGNAYITANEVDDSYIANVILKYTPNGKQLFNKTIDAKTSDLELNGLQIQNEALYLVGTKYYNWEGNPFEKSDTDGFVAKHSLNGERVWQKGFGTTTYDGANGLSVDADGGTYLTGYTHGTLGAKRAGDSDIFLRKLDRSGNTLWTKQFGSKGGEGGSAVAAYSENELYLVGSTDSTLPGGTHRGGYDGFLSRTDSAGNRVWTDQ